MSFASSTDAADRRRQQNREAQRKRPPKLVAQLAHQIDNYEQVLSPSNLEARSVRASEDVDTLSTSPWLQTAAVSRNEDLNSDMSFDCLQAVFSSPNSNPQTEASSARGLDTALNKQPSPISTLRDDHSKKWHRAVQVAITNRQASIVHLLVKHGANVNAQYDKGRTALHHVAETNDFEMAQVLQFASHSFDAILVEVLTPLLAGACVCIPSDERRLNDLAGAIRDLRVNWMGVTPTLAKVIDPKDVPEPQTLCPWGEPATGEVIESWADAVEMINIYGPSEASVESTFHSWSKGTRNPSHIGKAIKAANTWIVRLDNREQLAPIGTIGELAVQGPTVARGYLHDHVRSSVSFKDGAPWLQPDAVHRRVYYTSDLVRYAADGSLEFWGRRDTQVKIRGHRVDLQEIEYHINHSQAGSYMTSVVEVVRPAYSPTQNILVAFICERRDAICSSGNPLQAVSNASRNTAVMIEKYLVNCLPALNNPRLAQFASIISKEHATVKEKQASTGYLSFSSLPHAFVDDFLREVAAPRLGVEVSDIEDAALATDYQIENLAWSSLKSRGGTNYIRFQFRNAGLDHRQLQLAIERLVSYHQILRTVYLVYQRRVYQVVLKQIPVEIVHCTQTRDVSKTTSALIESDSRQPVDITRALIKFWLVRDTYGAVKYLVLRASHLQYDDVSLIRLCKELGLAFAGADLLPTSPYFGYVHFAANHDEQGARQFWRSILAGSSMTSVVHHTIEMIVDTAIVRSHSDITIGTTIKAAWSLVLAEMAGSDDVVFGSVTWGRNAMYPGVEDVTGACIDNIPVRVRLTPNMTQLDLLQQVQGQYFEAVSYESFRFKRIVEEYTDWKPWERLSSLVEYENLGEDFTHFIIDERHDLVVDEVRPPAGRHDITIYSTPVGDQETFIALDFCKAVVTKPMAQRMLTRMIEHIRQLHDDPYGPIVLGAVHETGLPHIPIPVPATISSEADSCVSHDHLNIENLDDDLDDPIRKLVERAWTEVLVCQPVEGSTNYWTDQVPFYHVWGNLMASYGLAKY
ncbi:hypothetical protein UA08_00560 [Talaromyces atroroseus]|uniref:Uncharacterized protein n=1 Tax=Talaromyces atroroseus TaxID=1441469 RepID=A0A225B4D5_TALAT|nr:hypothetical protein UA08_00560 [Talaromyces atroroseus]OKL64608.1 hypothetical protein UA08_00560 [Talaromyces atroroseus]